ncbi:MAG: 50S ribosomal protein L29 [Candidatus Theseobacter exili]|nr:50S ribosomal protein L29 [Candidatus Theseobacter exili]
MKSIEIRELTKEEIQRKIVDFGEELFKLRAQAKTGQLDKASLVKEVKRDIARCKTVLLEMGQEEQTQ